MNTVSRCCIVLVLSVAGLCPPVAAQQAAGSSPAEQYLRELSRHTGEIVDLLERLVSQRAEEHELRRLQVAVLALQLRSTTIADIEDRIRALEDRIASANEELVQIEVERTRLDTFADDDSLPEKERDRLQSMHAMLDSQAEMVNQRVWNLERQVADLQNELTSKRRDIDVLEEVVMEGLGDF